MVQEMVFPQTIQGTILGWFKAVLGIVEGDVQHVTKEKSGKEGKSIFAHQHPEKSEKNRREDECRDRRHGQACGVFRVLMMNGMSHMLYLEPQWVGCLGMVYITMYPVLGKCPRQHARKKQPHEIEHGMALQGIIRQPNDDQKVQGNRDSNMCPCKLFHQLIPE